MGQVQAQNNPLRRMPGLSGGMRGMGGMSQGKADSLEHRTGKEDSITIRYRLLDNSRYRFFDSSLIDFTDRFPLRWTQVNLGNLGNAAENRRFSPTLQSGWNHGFHAFDAYQFSLPETRFYNTTRPYSELGYLIGSKAEQMISLLHTQNIRPNWNAALQYRLVNSPGNFQNQNTNHNNYRFTSWYQSKNKRYQQFLIILGNKLQSGENGGIRTDGNYLDSSVYSANRYIIPTVIGGNNLSSRNFFSSTIRTGNLYTTAEYILRQQYDLGQKDSLRVNDTTLIRLFYPRLRFEYEYAYRSYNFRFKGSEGDSLYYKQLYGLRFKPGQPNLLLQDQWKEWLHDFSVYTFPDAKNVQQFLKLGAAFQTVHGAFDSSRVRQNFTNLYVHGEYRNFTRNKKWEIEALGNFYVNGYHSGDYHALLTLQRFLRSKEENILLGFENANRKPSFVFNPVSSFHFDSRADLNKENTTRLFGTWNQKNFQAQVQYLLLSNYTYFSEFYKISQVSTLFTVLQVSLFKDVKLGRKGWHWRNWAEIQQKTGSASVNLPLLMARSQLAYDGNLGFRNLLLSTGVELRYFTPYKANGYSPVTGQFFYQDQQRIAMRFPELAGYLHFRIRSFLAYVRAENLNALDISTGAFTRNNQLLYGYPTPGLTIRFGIFWSFVN